MPRHMEMQDATLIVANEQFVEQGQSRHWMATLKHRQLLPEGEIL